MEYKVGDKVRILDKGGISEDACYIGAIVTVQEVDSVRGRIKSIEEFHNKEWGHNPGWYEKVNSSSSVITNKPFMASLIEKAKLALKGEPEKSFIKAGIMNMDESFTSEGRELFQMFLYTKFSGEFKTSVVDPLIEADKEAAA